MRNFLFLACFTSGTVQALLLFLAQPLIMLMLTDLCGSASGPSEVLDRCQSLSFWAFSHVTLSETEREVLVHL